MKKSIFILLNDGHESAFQCPWGIVTGTLGNWVEANSNHSGTGRGKKPGTSWNEFLGFPHGIPSRILIIILGIS